MVAEIPQPTCIEVKSSVCCHLYKEKMVHHEERAGRYDGYIGDWDGIKRVRGEPVLGA